MHELSIAQALSNQIAETLEHENASRATKVAVAVGSLSGVEPHALEMAFPIATEAAGLGDIDLELEQIESKVHCNSCGHEFEPEFPAFLCENCDSSDVDIIRGRELEISSLQIERENKPEG